MKQYSIQSHRYCFPGGCPGHLKSEVTFRKCSVPGCTSASLVTTCIQRFFQPFGERFQGEQQICMAHCVQYSTEANNTAKLVCNPKFCVATTILAAARPRRMGGTEAELNMHKICQNFVFGVKDVSVKTTDFDSFITYVSSGGAAGKICDSLVMLVAVDEEDAGSGTAAGSVDEEHEEIAPMSDQEVT